MNLEKVNKRKMKAKDKIHFEAIIALLNEDKYEGLVKTYSTKDGWVNAAYKGERIHLSYRDSLDTVREEVDNMFKK